MSRFNNDQSYQQYEIREAINYLIEITPELLQHSQLGHSKLEEILTSINELMQELIITNRSSGIGIYFYNCQIIKPLKSVMKVSNDGSGGFAKLFGLKGLNLTNMSRLNDLLTSFIDGDKTINDVFKYFPMKQDSQLVTILNKMIDEFNKNRYFNKRKLIWITTNDKPYSDPKTKDNLWRVIDDYYHYDYKIEPMFINNDNKQFDFELFKDIFMNTDFFKNKITNDNENTKFTKSKIFETPVLANQIKKSILRAREIRRIQFTCDLILSDNGKLGGKLGCTIKGYSLYSHEKVNKNGLKVYTRVQPMKKVFIDSTILQNGKKIELKSEKGKSVAQIKDEAGIRHGYPIGDDTLLLNKEQYDFFTNYTFDHRLQENDDEIDVDESDINQVSLTPTPYLKLIGFRDVARFNPVYSCGAPTFITADLDNGLKSSSLQGGYTNSLNTFASLYRSMKKLDQYAIVFGCTRKSSKPYLYSLFPHDYPQGFLLVKMPWLDDVRALPAISLSEEENSKVDLSMVDIFKSIFPKFELTQYDPSNWPNPSLNYFYKVMKHEFLQIELPMDERSTEYNEIDILMKEDKLFRKSVDVVKKLSQEEKHVLNKLGLDGGLSRKRSHENT